MTGGGEEATETSRQRTHLGRGQEFDRIRAMLALEEGADASGAVGGGDAVADPRGRSGERPVDRPAVRVGPGDDAAVLEPISDPIVVSCDASIEGVHFHFDWMTATDAGYRAAAVAASDLAAMAATPLALLVSYAIPADAGSELAVELQRGVLAFARDAGMSIAGGDLTRSPGPVMIDVVVIGRAASPILRSGARPGDELWVTGGLGGPAEVVARLAADGFVPDDALARYRRPAPRLDPARWLAEAWRPTAMIDLSDGLAGDAGHLAAASGTSVVLDAERIPVVAWLREAAPGSAEAALHRALYGGDDYELCFTMRSAPDRTLHDFEARFGLPLTRVGTVVDVRDEPVWLRRGGEEVPLGRGGFDHFAPSSHGGDRP